MSLGLSGTTSGANYERFEASAIKMKQAESFFQAAPEALVQLSVLLVVSNDMEFFTLDSKLCNFPLFDICWNWLIKLMMLNFLLPYRLLGNCGSNSLCSNIDRVQYVRICVQLFQIVSRL